MSFLSLLEAISKLILVAVRSHTPRQSHVFRKSIFCQSLYEGQLFSIQRSAFHRQKLYGYSAGAQCSRRDDPDCCDGVQPRHMDGVPC
jgi:hypothetical protein